MEQSKFFSRLKEALDSIYPDRYSIKIRTQHEVIDPLKLCSAKESYGDLIGKKSRLIALKRARQPDRRTSFQILIYFPEIEITNNIEDTHTIYDYVFKINGSIMELHNQITITDWFISGKSFSVNTFNAVNITYMHSHQRPNTDRHFDSFCLGDTSLSDLYLNIREMVVKDDNLDKAGNLIEMFLIEVEQFLKWESLEGGPFQTIGHCVLKYDYKTKNRELFMDLITKMQQYVKDKEGLSPIEINENAEFVISDDFLDNYYDMKLGVIKGTSFRFLNSTLEEFKQRLYDIAEKNAKTYLSKAYKAYNVANNKIHPQHIKCEFSESDVEYTSLVTLKQKLENLFRNVYKQEILQFLSVPKEEISSIDNPESSALASFRRAV